MTTVLPELPLPAGRREGGRAAAFFVCLPLAAAEVTAAFGLAYHTTWARGYQTATVNTDGPLKRFG